MTPTNDERERMAREEINEEASKGYEWAEKHLKEKHAPIAYEYGVKAGMKLGIAWADANPKPVGDLLTLSEEVRDAIHYSDLPTSNIILKALSRVASETEARVRAETIEECAKVCENEEKEYQKSMEEFDRLGDTRMGTNEARGAVSAKYCAELIRALASNRSREGGK